VTTRWLLLTAAVLASFAAAPAAHARPLEDVVADASRSVVVIHAAGGEGSGFAFGRPGELLTNAHVVGSDEVVEIVTADGKRGEGRVTGVDPDADLARIRTSLAVEALDPARSPARPGQAVLAIGSPSGLQGTVTRGIVSAVDRRIGGAELLQTDLAVNPGNSGGPLLTEDGVVLGVITAKARSGEGIAFAVPIDAVSGALSAPPAEPARTDAGGGPAAAWYVAAATALGALTLLAVALRRRVTTARWGVRPPLPAAAAHEEPLVIVRRASRRRSDPTPQSTEDPWISRS
jgi:S1-C subfamily serine protease